MMRGRFLLVKPSTASSVQKAILSNASRQGLIACSDRLLTTYSNNKNNSQHNCNQHVSIQPFSTSSSSSGGGNKDDENKEGEDPFGLNYQDNTTDNIGTSIPPSYTRDQTTGKFTGEVQNELSPADLKLLNLNAVDAEQKLVQTFVQSWDSDDNDGNDSEEKLMELAERVREEQIAFGTIGRAPRINTHTHTTTDNNNQEEQHDNDKYTSGLTPSEASTLKQFLKRRYNRDITSSDADNNDYNLEDDIPIQSIESGGSTTSNTSSPSKDDENVDLDLTYLTPSAQKILHESNTGSPPEDPFLELMPHDLNPTRKVNRRRAKLIPKQLLHHNNLSLVRRYLTPAGQIMNRVQSRLGAKDQRKIAKMVKRARHLGLIPHMGQWKFEDHGNVSELKAAMDEKKKMKKMHSIMGDGGEEEEGFDEDDLMVEKDWEKELKRRGLVIDYNKPVMSPEMFDKMLDLERRILGDGGGADETVDKED